MIVRGTTIVCPEGGSESYRGYQIHLMDAVTAALAQKRGTVESALVANGCP